MIEKMKELEAKATAVDIDRAEQKFIDAVYECPLCHGDGEVNGNTYINFDDAALGVQFFGIGEKHKHWQEYFRASREFVPEAIRVMEEMAGALEDIQSVEKPEFVGAPTFWMEKIIDRCNEALASYEKFKAGVR